MFVKSRDIKKAKLMMYLIPSAQKRTEWLKKNKVFFSMGENCYYHTKDMNQNGEIRVLYVQPGKYPEEIKIPNTLETFQKYVCGSIESVR